MTADIKTFCQQCQRCQRSNASNKPQVATLHPVPVKGLFHRWGIDLVGPLKETSDGKLYVIVATEYLDKMGRAGKPVDLEYQVDDATCDVDMDDVDTRMKQLADLTKHRDTAQDNISDAQKKQKKRYDIKHRGSIFEIGDHVAIVNRRRDTRKGDKLAPRFKGPYTVTQTLGKGLYVLKKGDAVLKTKYNAVNLKRWNKPESATKSVRTEELPQRSSKWVPKFKLNESDRCDILNGAWLSDRVIDACHMLITESTGIQNQSTLLKQTAFKPMDTTVQILHDHDHWVTVSGSKDGIQFADSIPSHPITDNIKR
ncbi:uncharacterized protein LOC121374476 [Gigantopelta aegis]|uniref:uncharacterized protein LOC121374476 n=1 Tax=Gigantopelta aegis TaxID=1735272 RepID=UPI001B88BF84|nr:uncharacterized protein LOC121374476 [Gigantopelta aegis]